jgi:tRNA(Ile)-lysidine synthase
MAARRVRHSFLARTARRFGAEKVVLAHHADDQLELFFLRLFRGTGSDGLAGMKWSNHAPGTPVITLVRPLLGVSKTDLEEYARSQGIAFREDATNADVDIPRNRIRHELLPFLRKHFQSQLHQVLPRTMDILGAESDYLLQTARDWLKASPLQFSALPIALQRRVIQLQLFERGIVPEFEQVETLRLNPETVLEVRLGLPPGGVSSGKKSLRVLVDEAGRLRGAPPAVEQFTDSCAQICLPPSVGVGTPSSPVALVGEYGDEAGPSHSSGRYLARGVRARSEGRVEFGGLDISWKLRRAAGAARLKSMSGSEIFDADRVGGRVVLRHWQPGDRFQPIGMKQLVKLQNYFVNMKVPREARHRLVVAAAESGEVFWVEGLRISERFKLTPQTTRSLQWSWKRL